LADFNNFWHVTPEKNLTQMTFNTFNTLILFNTFNTVATLPCEMQKT